MTTDGPAESIGAGSQEATPLVIGSITFGPASDTSTVSKSVMRRLDAMLTLCHRCRWKFRAMDEHGRSGLKCQHTMTWVNPSDCGRFDAGCEE